MNIKAAVAVLIFLTSAGLSAQPKAFTFSDIQYRNDRQQWQEFLKADEDCVAYFGEDEIALNIDKLYHLTIKSTTHLPNGGVIYLCKDEKQRDLTITLIGDDRMFVYNNEMRFQINFTRREIAKIDESMSKTQTVVATAED